MKTENMQDSDIYEPNPKQLAYRIRKHGVMIEQEEAYRNLRIMRRKICEVINNLIIRNNG